MGVFDNWPSVDLTAINFKEFLDELTAVKEKIAEIEKGISITIAAATTTDIGGIKAGNYISVADDGTAVVTKAATADSVNWNNVTNKPSAFTPTIATATSVGGVKVGEGLGISASGTLYATGEAVATNVDWENIQNKPDGIDTVVNTATAAADTAADAAATATTAAQTAMDAQNIANTNTNSIADINDQLETVNNNVTAAQNTATNAAGAAATAQTTADEALTTANAAFPIAGGTATGDIKAPHLISVRDRYAGFQFFNANNVELGSFITNTTDGSYAPIRLYKNNSTTTGERSYVSINETNLTFKNKNGSESAVYTANIPIIASSSQIGGLKAYLSGTTLVLSTT